MRDWLLILLLALGFGRSAQAADWTTPAEQSGFRTTPNYADTLAYLKRLEKAAPRRLHLQTYGISPQGRPMAAVIASRGWNRVWPMERNP